MTSASSALSACICALGCFTTVTLMARAAAARVRAVLRWQAAAAVTFGCGVWSLHFVAMLAFMPGLTIAYDVALTATSVVVAAGGRDGGAVHLAMRRSAAGAAVGLAGTVLGLAVAAMHYIGVAAMRFSGFLLFDDVLCGEPRSRSASASPPWRCSGPPTCRGSAGGWR